MKTRKPIRLEVSERLSADSGTLDKAAGVVRNVKILGIESKNGPNYRSAYKNAATKYEGAFVSLNHPDKAKVPDVESRFGQLTGIYAAEDGLYAKEFRYNTAHPYAETFGWFAEHMPGALSFSHRVEATGTREAPGSKKVNVESIDRVFGVELVSDGGTTKTLFESREIEGEPEAVKSDPVVENLILAGFSREAAEEIAGAQVGSSVEEFREAEIGDRVLCDGCGYPEGSESVGEVVKKAPALLIRIGDRLVTKFEDEVEVVNVTPTADPAATTEAAQMKTLSNLSLEEFKAARPDLVESLGGEISAELKRVTQERDAANAKLAELEKSAKLEETRKARRALCEEAGVEATETFVEALVVLPDETAKKLVTEQAGKVKAGSRPRIVSSLPTGSAAPAKLTEAVFQSAVFGS